jgi:hypothetical protein
MTKKMTSMKTLMVTICIAGLLPLALAQNSLPPRTNATDAKNHVGETVAVCGKVVDTKVSKYGIAGHGKPVTFDLDQPEPNPVFYFVAFGTAPAGPTEAISAYNEKQVCVTGKINVASSGGPPFILAADRSQIKLDADAQAKPDAAAK